MPGTAQYELDEEHLVRPEPDERLPREVDVGAKRAQCEQTGGKTTQPSGAAHNKNNKESRRRGRDVPEVARGRPLDAVGQVHAQFPSEPVVQGVHLEYVEPREDLQHCRRVFRFEREQVRRARGERIERGRHRRRPRVRFRRRNSQIRDRHQR
jgi:hypothetical protein